MPRAHPRRSSVIPSIILASLSLAGSSAIGEVRHVPSDRHPTIQSCIDQAIDGDTCVVAPGRYHEVIDFLGKAITLRSSHGADVTTIDGTDLNNSVVKCVTDEGPDTLLDGFTVTGGTGSEFPFFSVGTFGGGMFNVNSSPTVANCTFEGNSASNGGGGLFNGSSDSRVTITNCNFRNNAAQLGGGIYNLGGSPSITNCTFSRNTASSGGGMFNLAVRDGLVANCLFSENSASFGGGLQNDGSTMTVRECTFRGNSAGEGGGARNGFTGTYVFERCTFAQNTALRFRNRGCGGGVANRHVTSASFSNCMFLGNRAGDLGGAVFIRKGLVSLAGCSFTANTSVIGGAILNDFGSPTFVNCSFGGNVSSSGEGGAIESRDRSSPLLANCILWGNGLNPIVNTDGDTTVSFSDVQGGLSEGVIDGGGNIDADPLFVRNPDDGDDGWGDDPDTADIDEGANDDFGDLRLRFASPCIDAGNNESVPDDVTMDLADNPRFVDDPDTDPDSGVGNPPIVDMGALEFPVDCNLNGLNDHDEIASGEGFDCNDNTYPDDCDPDADNDGFIDDCDACPQSLLDETLVIGDCDTGVMNFALGDGCTAADLIAECLPVSEDSLSLESLISERLREPKPVGPSWEWARVRDRNRSRSITGRQEHPVVCLTRLARTWLRDQLISGREFGRIISCAAGDE